MEKDIKNIALTAFEFFSEGWNTGNFDKYLAMITDDFTFSFPEGKHAGVFTGKEGKGHMIAKCLDHSKMGERLVLNPPFKITMGENTVVLEFEAEGNLGGKYYLGNIAISFDISGDKVSGFREYNGFSV
jgi:hypothetical protein